MARMHSGARGKSGSKRPLKKSIPLWVTYKQKETEMIISKLAKEGKTAAEIGIILRDTYGIPDVKLIFKKKITEIMKEKGVTPEVPEDLLSLIRRSVLVRKHMGLNKKDMTAKHGLQLTESKIKRLVKYYKRVGRLEESWKYDPERAGFFMK